MNPLFKETAYPRPSGWRHDDGTVGGGPGLYRLLDEAGEAVADALGGAAVEAKDVLVEIGGQTLLADRTVVGAQEPALGKAEHEMDGGEAQGGIAPGGAEIDRLVTVARGGQAAIAGPAVGGDGSGLGEVGGEEAFEARGPGVGQPGE